jgi:hypothetical protein
VTEQADIETVARQFYSDLFTAQELLEPEPVLDYVPVRVTDQMNAELTKPFEAEEVRNALFMMGPNKSPGSDGFTAGFFQHHWQFLGPSITKGVLDFLNGGEMPNEVDMTTISLCNVIDKLCSKVLSNRLH